MSTALPPGWYPDSADPHLERWWDGGTWSHVTRPAPAQVPDRPPAPDRQAGLGQARTPASVLQAVATPDGALLAAPGQRLAARLLDSVIIFGITLLVGSPFLIRMFSAASQYLDRLAASSGKAAQTDFYTAYTALAEDDTFRQAAVGYQFVGALVGLAYCVSLLHLRGATLGKLAAGIRVRSWEAEGRPTWTQALQRWLTRDAVQYVPVVGIMYVLVLDSLWLLRDPRRQCLHDKLPGTVVVRSRPPAAPGR